VNVPPVLSVVVPVFNERENLDALLARLLAVLEPTREPFDIVFVDDGSRDGSAEMLDAFHARDARVKVVHLSRNFGHQAALQAGLDHARGDAVVMMDADLQDPPELLGQFVAAWRGGHDVVYAVRKKRREHALKRFAYAAFYRTIKVMAEIDVPLDAGDFCLLDRRVVDVINRMPEHRVFLRGMRAWAGFRQRALVYARPARAAGETKYGLGRLLSLAANGLFSFTLIPLRLATWLGLLLILLSGAWGAFVLAWRLLGFRIFGLTASQLPGWTGFVLLLILFGSVQLVLLGVLGEYVGRIYEETKGRPRWVIEAAHGFEREHASRG